MTQFNLFNIDLMAELRDIIGDCQEKGHIQQVAFSSYEDALTQICFSCKAVRTNIKGLNRWLN